MLSMPGDPMSYAVAADLLPKTFRRTRIWGMFNGTLELRIRRCAVRVLTTRREAAKPLAYASESPWRQWRASRNTVLQRPWRPCTVDYAGIQGHVYTLLLESGN